jgi:CRP/FNR family transcriptional regulator, cyclic AMP receptor protein
MRPRRYRRGDVLFAKGDVAEEMFYTVSGRYQVTALGVDMRQGAVFGELGLLAPEQLRTQTIECVEDGEVLVIGYAQVKELYYQNPEFGFYFLRLVAGRLFTNLESLERRLAEVSPPTPAPAPG